MPLWTDVLAPAVKRWELLVIAAHGNSLRALVKYLDGIYDEEIVGLNIPTGVPLVYALNDDLNPIRNYNLGDEGEIRRAAQAVANQGKAG
jgi:2,3-bisphosphoglycerate-dependent phosphoglycerate mutase